MERTIASASAVGAGFMVARRRAPRAAPVSFSRLVVGGLDSLLRLMYGVVDIDPTDPCLLRIQATRAPRAISVEGEIVVERGEPVVALHYRNEDLPPVPADGPDFAWVCRFRDQLSDAMHKLALRLESDPALADVKAVCGRMTMASGGRSAKARRFGAYFGLKPADQQGPDGFAARLHDKLEDIWLWALAWAYNPVCLRGRDLSRGRDEVWMSREDFIRRHRKPPAGRRSGFQRRRSAPPSEPLHQVLIAPASRSLTAPPRPDSRPLAEYSAMPNTSPAATLGGMTSS